MIAAGDSGQSNCTGIQAPGGEGTYYAQVIYAAQTALLAQQAANPGSQNAIILLTDGDATACASNANTTAGACNTKSQLVASEGTLNGTGTNTSNPTGYESLYLSIGAGRVRPGGAGGTGCGNAGTTVYTIGYGAETSGGCLSDKTYSTTVTTEGGAGDRVSSPARRLRRWRRRQRISTPMTATAAKRRRRATRTLPS